MSSQVATLIQTVTAGVASGNYNGSATTWYSVQTQASGYYGYSAGLNTVAYYTDQFFIGDLNVQVSLASTPGPNDWVDLESTMVGNTNTSNQTPIATTVNFVGNYTWVRIAVTNFSINSNQGPGINAGSILKVQYAY
jgi:hypothetical protein